MREVEVLIRIPEAWIEAFKAFKYPSALHVCVLQGTALPKGHGRLIDADKFIDALFAYGQADDKFKLGERIKYTPSEIWEIEKILAKTVIEADREDEDESD